MTSADSTKSWATTLITIVGFAATVAAALGGSFITSRVTNEGITQELAHERSVRLDDLRRDAYMKYLEGAEEVYSADEPSDQEQQAFQRRVRAAEAAVLLLATPRVQDEAKSFTHILLVKGWNNDQEYFDARNAFTAAAQQELQAASR